MSNRVGKCSGGEYPEILRGRWPGDTDDGVFKGMSVIM